MGAGVGDKNAKSRKIVQPLLIPLVVRQCAYVVVVRPTDELLCGGYKWAEAD